MEAKPRSNPKPPRVCIFCGGRPLTEEHIWSQWTYRYIPKFKGSSHDRNTYIKTAGIVGLKKSRRYQGEVNTQRIEAVCRDCNNKWMNSIENAAKRYLIPLFAGEAVVLSEYAQKVVATWIVMKCMVLEHNDPDETVSLESEREFLRLNREPPKHWTVWIGLQSGTRWRVGWTRIAITLGSAPRGQPVTAPPNNDFSKNTQSFTLGFKKLIVHAFYSRVPGMTPGPGPRTASFFRVIWPHPKGLLWPCTPIIPNNDINRIALALDNFAGAVPWQPGGPA